MSDRHHFEYSMDSVAGEQSRSLQWIENLGRDIDSTDNYNFFSKSESDRDDPNADAISSDTRFMATSARSHEPTRLETSILDPLLNRDISDYFRLGKRSVNLTDRSSMCSFDRNPNHSQKQELTLSETRPSKTKRVLAKTTTLSSHRGHPLPLQARTLGAKPDPYPVISELAHFFKPLIVVSRKFRKNLAVTGKSESDWLKLCYAESNPESQRTIEVFLLKQNKQEIDLEKLSTSLDISELLGEGLGKKRRDEMLKFVNNRAYMRLSNGPVKMPGFAQARGTVKSHVDFTAWRELILDELFRSVRDCAEKVSAEPPSDNQIACPSDQLDRAKIKFDDKLKKRMFQTRAWRSYLREYLDKQVYIDIQAKSIVDFWTKMSEWSELYREAPSFDAFLEQFIGIISGRGFKFPWLWRSVKAAVKYRKSKLGPESRSDRSASELLSANLPGPLDCDK